MAPRLAKGRGPGADARAAPVGTPAATVWASLPMPALPDPAAERRAAAELDAAVRYLHSAHRLGRHCERTDHLADMRREAEHEVESQAHALDKLEGALSPKAATLLWLAEAHQFGSLDAYIEWLIDQPISAAPLERVPVQSERAVRAAMRGQPREVVRLAAQRAIRDAIFGVELVIRLNGAAVELSKVEGLRYAVLFWQMRALGAEASLSGDEASRQATSASVARWRTWCTDVTALVTRLCAAEETRVHLERLYLDGHPALFPDAIEDGARLREGAERLAGLGDTLGPLFEGHPPTPGRRRKLDLDALRAAARRQAPALAARLVDEARLATLDVIGDEAAAAAIAARRFRAGMEADA
jgi:hypothetical protein